MLYNKEEIYKLLNKLDINHQINQHPPVYTMEELDSVDLPYPDLIAKNLLVRDDKKKNYYQIVVKGDKRVDLKAFRQDHQTRRLSMAKKEELEKLTGLQPGELSPFGLLNDSHNIINCYIDEDFKEGEGVIGIHPNDNAATVWINTYDLVEILEGNGTKVEFVKLS